MKELGFRVWDKQKRSYEWDREFVLGSGGGLMELCSNHDGTWKYRFADTDRFIIELDTGLHDRDGKMIYEGDIIQEEVDTGDDLLDGIHEYIVVWDKDCLCWGLKGAGFKNDLYEVNRTVEVVGNIHEARS